MAKSLEGVLYEIGLENLEKRKADQKFADEKARKESSRLAHISSVLLSLWDLAGIILKNPGKKIIIDSDTGEIYTGIISDNRMEKFHKLPAKVPGRLSLEIDRDSLTSYLTSRSFVFSPGNPLKHRWENAGHIAPKEHGSAVVYNFEERLSQVSPKEIHKKITTNSLGHKFVEISIDDYPVSVGMSLATKKVQYYIFEGKTVEI